MRPAANPLHQTLQSNYNKSTVTGCTDSTAVRDGVRGLVNRLLNCKHTSNGYPAVVVDQPCLLERKLNALLDRGIGAFQVVSDFDHTLSKFRHNNISVPITHGVFYASSNLPPAIKQLWEDTLEFYLPIERDLTMPDVKKAPQMVEFWNKAHDLLVQANLHQSLMKSVMQHSRIVLREHVHTFLRLLREHGVPVLVFSAGIGDIIETVLEQEDLCSDNLRILSNFMDFDSEGNLTGFRSPLVHMLNKTIRDLPELQELCSFPDASTLLLLGDSVADTRMVDEQHVPSEVTLKIGFLNEPGDESLALYKSIYDVVLVEDETFRVPLMILELLLCAPKPDGAKDNKLES
ncbi:Cytosolic 5'-nucleotidase 3A [Clonorchis sinensis]|uniref:5'-nucleotidase n=1 Tax=Clonorchis sinensis TaxID=79923 RepID=A0A8T1MXL1_CLOSI|nr:Cytosolic 5'-nucleotidase 3A [Clonorchis sinensis]